VDEGNIMGSLLSVSTNAFNFRDKVYALYIDISLLEKT
jgi:hypothetical protein